MAPHGHSHDDHHGHSHDTPHAHSHGAPSSAAASTAITINFGELQRDTRARPLLIVTGVCTVCLFFMMYSVSISRSLILTGCTWMTLFSIMSLASAMLSLGARKSSSTNTQFTYGMARVPVLTVFASTVLAQLAALFLVKESIEHLLEAHEEHAHGHWLFMPAVLTATVAQLLAIYAVQNEPMRHVLTAAQNSWLQEQAADMSRALCRYVPGLARFLLPRINSLTLLTAVTTASCLLFNYLHVHRQFWWADAIGILTISMCVIGSMWPLSTYTGRILLQTTPPYMITQLDKCVRECETLDGVLVRSGGVVAHELSRTQELTQSHFWQLDYQRMCGTVVVRVRRDADEQQVLALVTEKLSAVVAVLTVQVVKTTDAYTSSKRACVHACTRVAVGASMQHDSRTWSRTLDAAQRTGSAHRSPATASAHAHSHEHGGHGHAH